MKNHMEECIAIASLFGNDMVIGKNRDRNYNPNLKVVRELDGYGTEEFLKIIRFVVKDANVFVISHKTGIDDRFGSVLRFEKIKGFSRLGS